MGISFSCNGNEYDDVFNQRLEALIMRSIDFKGDAMATTLRSISFNGRDADRTTLKSFGSGRMMAPASSVSLHGSEPDPSSTISIKTPQSPHLSRFDDAEISSSYIEPTNYSDAIRDAAHSELITPKHEAAVRLQKVYKSFRTRRRLADCAVLVEQRWWKLLDFAVLKRSSVSFFDIGKPETAVSRWSRARTRAAKVGKGLSKDEKARKLAFQHWLEAIDPRHRYGHNLQFYYDSWLRCESRQPFFYWLDVGEGRDFNHEICHRSKLHQQCIKYLGPKEREAYEVGVDDGKLLYQHSRQLLDTCDRADDGKWIFVLSTSKTLYVGQKKKGTFQHSSFLAGGATSAAGRLEVEKGVLKAVWPHSGHYRPTEENFQEFISFLREKNVDLTDVKMSPTDDAEVATNGLGGSSRNSFRRDSELNLSRVVTATDAETSKLDVGMQDPLCPSHAPGKRTVSVRIPDRTNLIEQLQTDARSRDMQGFNWRPADIRPVLDHETGEEEASSPEQYMSPKWDLFEEDHEGEREDVPEESILRRINSKKGTKSYQLGKQLSFKWTTGAGPRIGCVRDYPTELQYRALEQMSLSPKSSRHCRTFFCNGNAEAEHPGAFPSPQNLPGRHCRTTSSLRDFFSPRSMQVQAP